MLALFAMHYINVYTYGVFFSIKKCALYVKNAILCLFLKNVSKSTVRSPVIQECCEKLGCDPD